MGVSLSGAPLLARRPKYRWRFLLALGLLCWLLASLRYVTGFDYRSYESMFQEIAAAGLPALRQSHVEPGFVLLNLAVALPGGNYRAFLFFSHFLFTALVFLWIGKYASSVWISAYLFLTLQYFAMSMNLLRQAFAMAVVLWAYPFLRARRFFPYCGVVFLAACFHKTAFIMLPMYVPLNMRVSRLHYGTAALAAGSAYFFIEPLMRVLLPLFPMYQGYSMGRYWQGNSAVYLLFPLGCFLFAWPLLRRAARGDGASPVLANCAFYSLLIQLFITRHFILERLSIYTAAFSLIALPEAALMPDGKVSSRVRTGILLAGGFAYFLFAAGEGFHGVYPFHGIWSKALSIPRA